MNVLTVHCSQLQPALESNTHLKLQISCLLAKLFRKTNQFSTACCLHHQPHLPACFIRSNEPQPYCQVIISPVSQQCYFINTSVTAAKQAPHPRHVNSRTLSSQHKMTCPDNSNMGVGDSPEASLEVQTKRIIYGVGYGMMVAVFLYLMYCTRRTLNRLFDRYMPREFDNRLVRPALKTIAVATAALLWPLSTLMLICNCLRVCCTY